MSRGITLAIVAREAGVSTSTASAALAGTGRVSAATAQRVREVATRLGYRLDHAGRSLRQGRVPHVGLVLDVEAIAMESAERPALWWPRACLSLTHELGRHGVAVTLISADEAVLEHPLSIDALVTIERPDGSAVLPDWLPFGTPVLLGGDLGRDAPPSVRRVAPDYATAEALVLDHLWDVGARRPALLRLPSRISPAEHTEVAYREWCRAHGVEPIVVGRAGGSLDACVAGALDHGADALHSEVPATSAVLAAVQKRAAVPSEVRLVVTAEGLIEQHLAVTTLSFNGTDSGRLVARELLRALRTGRVRNVRIPATLTARASTTG